MENITTYILLAILGAVALYVVVTYNRLVNLKHAVTKAWSNIDVLLKQRHDELPKLVETCRQYMDHEKDTLERVTSARNNAAAARGAGDISKLGAAEGMLRGALGQLFAVVEDYPELKANEQFQHLQGRITGLENQIADRREFYNETVNNNNVTIEEFPDIIVARLFNFKDAKLLTFKAEELKDVNMRELFQS